MSSAAVYEWCRSRGYWLARASTDRPTHLLLDGGRLRVPDESHGDFVNAYAAALVRYPARRPCVVELRTPVFKMFADVDVRFESEEGARAPTALVEAFRAMTRCCAADRALVCASNEPKHEEDGSWKRGFHVVWPEVRVGAKTALALRAAMLDALRDLDPRTLGVRGGWDTILDASVYTSNGLRMPWSAKGRGEERYYRLEYELTDDAVHPRAPRTVSELRAALHLLSIRTFGLPATHRSGDDDDDDGETGTTAVRRGATSQYADVLPRVADCLPIQFAGQQFSGLVATDNCFMLRSTARYCFNLGRAHRTNNVYFMLTRKGVCQRCYCRCDTSEGRKYGLCKDFSSPYWAVPPEVLKSFFGDSVAADDPSSQPPQSHQPQVSAMPSRASKVDIDALLARSRPAPAPRARKKLKTGG